MLSIYAFLRDQSATNIYVNCKLYFLLLYRIYMHCNFICGLSDVNKDSVSQSVSQTNAFGGQNLPDPLRELKLEGRGRGG